MTTTNFRQYNEEADALDFPYDYNKTETGLLHTVANRNGQVDLNLLRRIALWKLDRVLNVSSETIKRLQALATDDNLQINSTETRSLIGQLMECEGIGLPMASTILKFLRPDVFPIIDVRAYRTLYGKKPHFSQSKSPRNIDCYLKYVADIRRISVKLNRPLCDIDEQLYEFDKKYNGKI